MNHHPTNSHCSCGKAQFHVQGEPLMRAFCHCTICQAFNQAPYADITLFRSKDVLIPQQATVAFKSYKFPPILQRGKCVACGGAAIECLQTPPLQIYLVPSKNITDAALVPDPSLHIFYDRRVSDIDDDLPKYSGYIKSQLAFGQQLITSLLHRGRGG